LIFEEKEMVDSSVSSGGMSKMNIALWLAQILLAIGFGMAGFMKTTTPIADLALQMGWVNDWSPTMVRFIGSAELAGAAGMILPSVTRILPWLTPLAALGFSVIQILAMPVHISRGEIGVLPINLTLLALSLFVLWGRWKKSPIAPR
jgi:putative oxidoreductase